MSLEANSHQYIISFRCPNCGDIFEKLIQKGIIAEGRAGKCPVCGVQEGQAAVGRFRVVRANTEHEEGGHVYSIPMKG